MAAPLPFQLFPGFDMKGVVSPALLEAATVFNLEGLQALQGIPEDKIAWADLGTRVSIGEFEVKVPINLTSLVGFRPFEGTRHFHEMVASTVTVRPVPWDMSMSWPLALQTASNPTLQAAYNFAGYAPMVVQNARAHKADLVASVVNAGFTGATLGVTAQALTLPQGGGAYPSGLPLFTDGTITPAHFANPLDANSARFNNWFYNVGKITATDVFGTVLQKMTEVPHASKANMTMGLGVTDIVGPTWMLIPFIQLAAQTLSLQTTTSPANLAAATTNIYNPIPHCPATECAPVLRCEPKQALLALDQPGHAWSCLVRACCPHEGVHAQAHANRRE